MSKIMFLVLLVFSCGSLALAQGGDWQRSYDARLGFTVEHPAGWTVQSKGYTILVQNEDGSSSVLVEAFPARAGESAKSRIGSISNAHPQLFSNVRVERIAQQPSAGDAAVGALSYRNALGQTAQARVLCLVYQGSGLLYAVSAPKDSFTDERPTLLRVLTSLRFGVKSSGASSATSRNSANGNAASSLRFVRWTDPKENAFSAEVPQGWTVDGGMFRAAQTDARQAIQLSSPDKDMYIRYNDVRLPTFLLPTPLNMRTFYVREGVPFQMGTWQKMLLRYMPARDFNQWYLNSYVKQNMDNFSITKNEEMPEISRQLTETYAALDRSAGSRGDIQVTVAQAEFSGVSKITGKPIYGMIISTVRLTDLPQSPNQTSWGAMPIMMVCTADDKAEMHKQMLIAAVDHIQRTWQLDEAWQEKYRREITAGTAQVTQETNAANEMTMKRSKEIARQSEARHQSIASSYWGQSSSSGDFNRKFNNYIGDNTDVRDPNTGQTYQVGSGYSNYYLDSGSGKIVGTNSAYRPPVDFTTLTEY